jgi:hypothetical protein
MTPASSGLLSEILSSPEMLKVCWANLFKDKEERVKQLTYLNLPISLGFINVAISLIISVGNLLKLEFVSFSDDNFDSLLESVTYEGPEQNASTRLDTTKKIYFIGALKLSNSCIYLF